MQRILGEGQLLKDFSATQAALACLLHQPAEAELTHIEAMVPRKTARSARTQFDSLCIGLADLRAGRYREARTELSELRAASTGPFRVAAGYYLAITLLHTDAQADAQAQLGAADRDAKSIAPADKDFIGLIGQPWLICQVARREAHELIERQDERTRQESNLQPSVPKVVGDMKNELNSNSCRSSA